jgi:hypothetical protein
MTPLETISIASNFGEVELSFVKIEEIIGRRLPRSADRPQWWANQVALGRPQREAWRAVGFDAFLIAGSRRVQFRRVPAVRN